MAKLRQAKQDPIVPKPVKVEVEEEEEEEDEEEEEVEEEAEVEEEEEEVPESSDPAANSSKTVQVEGEAVQGGGEVDKWPGWPGCSVFRLIMPVLKVGCIIGRKGELIKKLCEETKARVQILNGPVGTAERLVLVSGKEEPEVEISPAMEAVLRIFKKVNGISDDGTAVNTAVVPAVCAIRLLVPQSQSANLIGKHGSSIKSIQEKTGAVVRVVTPETRPYYASEDEKVVEIQGETGKVENALQAVLGHLRKFLVDPSIVPLFEKIVTNKAGQPVQQQIDKWAADVAPPQRSILNEHALPIPIKVDALFLERDPPVSVSRTGLSIYGRDPVLNTGIALYGRDPPLNDDVARSGLALYGRDPPVNADMARTRLSLYGRDLPANADVSRTGLSLYGRDPALSSYSSSGLNRPGGGGPLLTQVMQSMQIPLIYAEDIIGSGGSNISYIRVQSGALVTVQESRDPDEITVEIKGTSSQVQIAQQLVQDFLAGHKEAQLRSNYYAGGAYRSSYSQYSNSSSSHYGSNGSPRLGGGYGTSYRF